jgi:uncharacterized phage protein (TIGR02216 family)
MSRMDWPALMRAGLIGLRLPPAIFWSLSPAELHMMLGLDAGDTPMGRAALDALQQAYPDAEPGDKE